MIDIRTEQDLQFFRESEDVEFKEAVGQDGRGKLPDNFWDTYSAMANTDGGYVFLGIAEKRNKFHLAGLTSTESLRKNIVDLADNPNKVSVNLLTNDSFRDLNIDGNCVLCVRIPRARRQQRPVYLKNNPIGNAFRRLHEADQKLSDEEVKRYLAEQLGDTRDAELLPGYDIDDISKETLRAYRQLYANLQPEHPWNESEDTLFLVNIGAAQRNRETGSFSLTVAGLLMFGNHPVIQEKFSYKQALGKTGHSRSAYYFLAGLGAPLDPNDIFGPELSSTHLDVSSTHLGEKTKKKIERDSEGCIISKRLAFPVVDKLDRLSEELRTQLELLAADAREKKKITQAQMEQILISCCSQRYMTLAALAQLLKRADKTLRNSYLSRMVKEKKLHLAFPTKPNDPRQAYIAAESLPEEKECHR